MRLGSTTIPASCAPAQSELPPPTARTGLTADVPQRARDLERGPSVHILDDRHDGHTGAVLLDDVDPAGDRHVGTQVEHADALPTHGDSEGERAQLVSRARRQAHDHERVVDRGGGLIEGREPAVDGGAGGVLRGDIDTTITPGLAERDQRGHEQVVDDGLERTTSEDLVERGPGGGDVHGRGRVHEARDEVGGFGVGLLAGDGRGEPRRG